ncbi:MAG: acyl--CoA ligase, partial [Muribaculum sp.]|nr:acyl--CoA ligase [Muribaculum sp.]
MKRLEDYLCEHAQSSPNKTAFQNSVGTLTYNELWTAVCKRASELKSEASRVYVLRSVHEFDFIIDYFAAHKAGKVIVPLEKDMPDAQFQRILELTSQADIPEDVSDILFTTGTTGKQKGTMISESVIISDAENLIDAQGFSSDLMFIITGPLNHIGSLSKIWPSIIVGASIYIMDGLKDLSAFFKVVKDAPCKVATFQVPASLRMMLQFGEKQLKDCGAKFDFIETGAAPISQSDMEKLCELLPHTRLYNTYASTETGIIATYNFNGGHCVAGCLGKTMKHSGLTIDDEGFIICEGKTIMIGYCGDLEETNRVLKDNKIHTKDKGILDEEGRLQLAGREGDIINVGGYKINPVEVEDVAKSMPEIDDCICIPSPHPVIGTALRLLYVVKDGLSIEKKALAKHLASKLEGHKVPQLYTQVDKVERTYNGKLNRKAYSQ